MKILSKDEFIKLPSGTIYSDYDFGSFSGLKIKEGTIGDLNDFFLEDLIGNIKGEIGEFMELESSELEFRVLQREGLLDNKNYAVYELNDMIALRDRISECIDMKMDK